MAIEIFSLSWTYSFLHAKTIENYQAKISITQPWLSMDCHTFEKGLL
jgi:hypothetical protein